MIVKYRRVCSRNPLLEVAEALLAFSPPLGSTKRPPLVGGLSRFGLFVRRRLKSGRVEASCLFSSRFGSGSQWAMCRVGLGGFDDVGPGAGAPTGSSLPWLSGPALLVEAVLSPEAADPVEVERCQRETEHTVILVTPMTRMNPGPGR